MILPLAACLLWASPAQVFAAESTTEAIDSTEIRLLESPRDLLAESQTALAKAIREKDGPRIIEALLIETTAQCLIDTDSLPSQLLKIEQYAEDAPSQTEQSMLRLLCAKLYHSYYQRHRAEIEQQEDLIETDPADLILWSPQMFAEKIRSLISEALQPQTKLQQTPVSAYSNLFVAGNGNRLFRPTLYDFIAGESLTLLKDQASRERGYASVAQEAFVGDKEFSEKEYTGVTNPAMQEILQIYRNLSLFHRSTGNNAAGMMWTLDRLEWLFNLLPASRQKENDRQYRDLLSAMLTEYGTEPYSVEIVIARTQHIYAADYADKKECAAQCEQWIARYPDYFRIDCLQSEYRSLTAAATYLNRIPSILYPGTGQTVEIEYKNIQRLTVNIYRHDTIPVGGVPDRLKPGLRVYSRDYTFADTLMFELRPLQIVLPELPCGLYTLETEAGEDMQKGSATFSVTRLSTIVRTIGDRQEIAVVDFKTGKPQSHVALRTYDSRNDRLSELGVTGKHGIFEIKEKIPYYRNISVQAYRKDDDASPFVYLRQYTSTPSREENQLQLFTDASVYRPGQTVHFAGIAYRIAGTAYKIGNETQEILPNRTFTVRLNDANRKEIASAECTTDNYGALSGSFVLPAEGMTGRFTLSAEGKSFHRQQLSFLVAEYKRPAFEVAFTAPEGELLPDLPVHLQGTAINYAGAPQANATVVYSVSRWGETVCTGETRSDNGGKFTLSFIPEVSESRHFYPSYYLIEAHVTNTLGETITGNTSVTVGDKPFQIEISAGNSTYIDRQKPARIQVRIANFSGKQLDKACRVTLYPLIPDGKYDTPADSLKTGKAVASVQLPAGETVWNTDWNKLSSGAYRIVASALDDKGFEIEASQNIVLYSAQDKKPPVASHLWVPEKEIVCEAEQEATVRFGSSDKPGYLFYVLYDSQQIILSGQTALHNKCTSLKFFYSKGYDPELQLQIFTVKEGKLYRDDVRIVRNEPERRLTISAQSFRDRIQPGDREHWQFTVHDAQGNPVPAMFLCEMFDASLNSLAYHNWYFAPRYNTTIPASVRISGNYDQSIGLYPRETGNLRCTPLTYDRFRFIQSRSFFRWASPVFDYGKPLLKNSMAMLDSAMEVTVAEDEAAPRYEAAATGTEAKYAESGTETPFAYRETDQTTAFFYPHLRANDRGEIAVEFTVPGSNTEWDFMALAYTPDLKYGSFRQSAVSSKPLMVAPNLPRFVRQGDKAVVPVALQNRTDSILDGISVGEWFDPYTDAVVRRDTIAFRIAGTHTQTVEYPVAVPESSLLLGFRVKAVSPAYTDGEQTVLPVLPSHIPVTESRQFFIPSGNRQSVVTLSDMEEKCQSPSLTTRRMVLEYCDNPMWYAVWALPTLNTQEYATVTQIAGALYGQSVSLRIVRDNPALAEALRIWNDNGSDPMESPLDKNPDLKRLLTDETPWGDDAASQTARIRQLRDLLNANRAEAEYRKAILRLQEWQQHDGGWSWLKNSRSSLYITLHTLEMLARTDSAATAILPDILHDMEQKAVRYIDKEFVRPQTARTTLPDTDLYYLYVRSFYSALPMDSEVASKYDAQLARLKKEWNRQSLIGKAFAAQIAFRTGDTAWGKRIIRSLRQYATRSQQKGMYWANNRAIYSNYSALRTNCALYEAFVTAGAPVQEIDAMRQWLLSQKQTQSWGNSAETADAIRFLLQSGSTWIDSSPATDRQIIWGNDTLPASDAAPFTGYEKIVRDGSDVTPADARVKIGGTSKHPSWGGIYWQYTENSRQVKASSNEALSIERTYYRRTVTNAGESYRPVTETEPLKVGDRIRIRFTLRVGQAMNYVVLTDQRPAGFEPANVLPHFEYRTPLAYYYEPKDASVNFFFEFVPQGTYTVEYEVNVTNSGDYATGIADIQCYYAPQFSAHSSGGEINIKPE